MSVRLYEFEHSEGSLIHFHLFSIPDERRVNIEIIDDNVGEECEHDNDRSLHFRYLGTAVEGPGTWFRLGAGGDPLYLHGKLNTINYLHNGDANQPEPVKVHTISEETFKKLDLLLTDLHNLDEALPTSVRPYVERGRLIARALLVEVPKLLCPGSDE